jgi:hypothetical protein
VVERGGQLADLSATLGEPNREIAFRDTTAAVAASRTGCAVERAR